MRRRTLTVDRLEDHPNLEEILGVLAHVPHITDTELSTLAGAWRNTPALAVARDRALRPDTPLVVEVLAAFEAAAALFADDLAGEAAYVTVDPQATTIALKAIRDAIAAAYAAPVLSPGEYDALLAPWRSVYPRPVFNEPDLGPHRDQVKAVLAALPQLAARCHDTDGRALFDTLVQQTWLADPERHESARSEAWHAAVLTSRRRVWALVRRTASQGLSRSCTTCPSTEALAPAGPALPVQDEQRVAALCLDAICALLVADAVSDDAVEILTRPLASLLPQPRDAED